MTAAREDTHRGVFDDLVEVVLDDVGARLRQLEDRTVNRCRELTLGAGEHVEELERAGRELGRVRGLAAEETYQREADTEIAEVLEGTFGRLAERFLRRVETALEGLRDTPRYAGALRAWAAAAARAMDGPADVYAAAEDRAPLYEALLEQGATDFQVHADRDVRVGFVVRDLDGRTLLDRRPAAIVAERREALEQILRERIPEAPSTSREAG